MSANEPTSFDLIDQPWLPARTLDGEHVELSMADIFERAHELATLSGDLPTQTFALTRLLLAVLHGALKGPRDLDHWEQLWQAGKLPHHDIISYLDQYRSQFDLFHSDTPFFQVAALHTAKGETSELSKLIADVPNGRPFFTNRLGSNLSLSFAEAARWVVHCQAFDPSGIKSGAAGDIRVKGGKGYPIGTSWAGRLGGVMPEGATVRETLLLNLIPRDFGETARPHHADPPVWERAATDSAVLEGRLPTGPVDLYTWQSRRLRLIAEGNRVTRVLICNGDPLSPQNRHSVEPHTSWRRSQAQEKKLHENVVYMPREHVPERAIWRGLQSLLPAAVDRQGKDAASQLTAGVLDWLSELTIEKVLGGNVPVRVHTVGLAYGSNNSVIDDAIDDALSLQSELLRRDAGDLAGIAVTCVAASDLAARALGDLAQNLAQAAGKVPPAKPGLPDPSDVADRTRAVELAYAELDVPFRAWVARLGPSTDPTVAQIAWHRIANRIVRRLAADLQRRAPTTAWTGRRVNKRLVTAAHAAEWFDRKLRETLPQAYQSSEAPEGVPA